MMVPVDMYLLRKMSKIQLIRKVIRDTTQAQKTQMLKIVLARTSKPGLIKLCIAISKNKLMTLKKLTTSKGMNRITAKPKAFKKKRKTKTKTKTKKRKLRAGTIGKIPIKMANGKTRMQKVRVLSSGKYRFVKN